MQFEEIVYQFLMELPIRIISNLAGIHNEEFSTFLHTHLERITKFFSKNMTKFSRPSDKIF